MRIPAHLDRHSQIAECLGELRHRLAGHELGERHAGFAHAQIASTQPRHERQHGSPVLRSKSFGRRSVPSNRCASKIAKAPNAVPTINAAATMALVFGLVGSLGGTASGDDARIDLIERLLRRSLLQPGAHRVVQRSHRIGRGLQLHELETRRVVRGKLASRVLTGSRRRATLSRAISISFESSPTVRRASVFICSSTVST